MQLALGVCFFRTWQGLTARERVFAVIRCHPRISQNRSGVSGEGDDEVPSPALPGSGFKGLPRSHAALSAFQRNQLSAKDSSPVTEAKVVQSRARGKGAMQGFRLAARGLRRPRACCLARASE